jgi:hypothetical protein
MKRAGIAINSVKIGMKIRTRLRKNPKGTLDKVLRDRIITNIMVKGQKLRANPTVMMNSTKVAALTLGSRLWSNPRDRPKSSATSTDSRA